MKLVIYLFTILLSTQAMAKEVLVLVPGFFSTFTPEYFSKDIVKSFENKGFKVYVAHDLNPIGTIEENGERLEKLLGQIEKLENSKISFNVVAHSAGGFYTLFVANRQKFEIKNLLTVATPYKGVEFVQVWLDNSAIFNLLAELAHLDGLVQLTKTGVEKFLSSVRVSPKTKVVAFGGYQEKSLDVWNARFLSTPLRVTSHYISEKSDGIVGYSSALGLGNILTTDNTRAIQMKDDKYFLDLEHWEQVIDSDSFILLGIRNTSYIRKEQVRFYTGLADYLLTLK
ncbi:MAG: hypothetical protein ABL930_06555 [Pseudobdellovibrio sp.]